MCSGTPVCSCFCATVLLDARAFADDGVDWIQTQDAVVAQEGRAVPPALVEAELDDLDAARCRPCVGHRVAALAQRCEEADCGVTDL